jgi:uncharacterized RDD family membrane protein YckC
MEKYRTFLPRFVALLIDSFIMLPLGILDDWFRQAEFPPLFFYIWIPLSSLVFPVYTIMMHAAFGQTLGKMALNVKVLDATEEPIKYNQAIRREIPQLLFNFGTIYLGIVFLGENLESEAVKTAYGTLASVAAAWGLADVLTFLLSDKRRALHDLIAGTVVVKTNVRDTDQI